MIIPLTTLAAPVLARLTVRGMERRGWLPQKHYLQRALAALRQEEFEQGLRWLRLAARRTPGLAVLAALDLFLMHLDRRMDRLLAQREDCRRQLSDLIQRRRELRAQLCRRSPFIVWGKAAFRVGGFSGFIGILVGLSAPAFGWPVWIGAVVLLAGFAAAEQKPLRRNFRSMRLRRVQFTRRLQIVQIQLRQMTIALEANYGELARLQRLRTQVQQLMPAETDRGKMPSAGRLQKWWERMQGWRNHE